MKPGPEIGGSLHAIRVLILRLLVDPAEREALRGTVEPVPEGESLPFAGDDELLVNTTAGEVFSGEAQFVAPSRRYWLRAAAADRVGNVSPLSDD